MKVSVVIPVYNAEKYLKACLESLVRQTFSDWEAILVNDGSRDGSESICREYCDKDKRFSLITQENQGVSAARNKGLALCSGKYVFFMDADDTLLPNALKALATRADSENPDMIIFRFQKISAPEQIHDVRDFHCEAIDGHEAMRQFLTEKTGSSMWTKLVKKSLTDGVLFEAGRAANEDKYFLFELLKKCDKVLLSDAEFYCYWSREGSASNQLFSSKWFDCSYFAKKIYDEIAHENSQLEPEARYQLISVCYFLVRKMDTEKAAEAYKKEYTDLIYTIKKHKIGDIRHLFSGKRFAGVVMIKYFRFLYKLLILIFNKEL